MAGSGGAAPLPSLGLLLETAPAVTAQGGDPAPLPSLGLLLASNTPNHYTVEFGTGVFTISVPNTFIDREVSVAPGVFTLTGASVATPVARRLTVESGIFSLSGSPVGLLYTSLAVPQVGGSWLPPRRGKRYRGKNWDEDRRRQEFWTRIESTIEGRVEKVAATLGLTEEELRLMSAEDDALFDLIIKHYS